MSTHARVPTARWVSWWWRRWCGAARRRCRCLCHGLAVSEFPPRLRHVTMEGHQIFMGESIDEHRCVHVLYGERSTRGTTTRDPMAPCVHDNGGGGGGRSVGCGPWIRGPWSRGPCGRSATTKRSHGTHSLQSVLVLLSHHRPGGFTRARSFASISKANPAQRGSERPHHRHRRRAHCVTIERRRRAPCEFQLAERRSPAVVACSPASLVSLRNLDSDIFLTTHSSTPAPPPLAHGRDPPARYHMSLQASAASPTRPQT